MCLCMGVGVGVGVWVWVCVWVGVWMGECGSDGGRESIYITSTMNIGPDLVRPPPGSQSGHRNGDDASGPFYFEETGIPAVHSLFFCPFPTLGPAVLRP